MKKSEMLFKMLLDAGFVLGVDFSKHNHGIFFNEHCVEFLENNLSPDLAEDFKKNTSLVTGERLEP